MIGGVDGPVVILSAETAHLIERHFEVWRLRKAARGRRPRVSQELLDLQHVAALFDPASRSVVPEPEPFSVVDAEEWMSPGLVADLLGLTARGVRKACETGRLEAEQDQRTNRWSISRQAVEVFDQARKSAA